jgi:hypothetical protein
MAIRIGATNNDEIKMMAGIRGIDIGCGCSEGETM